MHFESIIYSDFPYLKEFEPPGWGDLVPRFKYNIENSFCEPVKLVIDQVILAIGTIIYHKDSAWLASIIVHPEHRNKGYGKLITQELVDRIDRSTYTTIYLDATEAGYPVYVKLGFELQTTYVHLRSEKNITGLQLSSTVTGYDEKYKEALLKMDCAVSCEDRQDSITQYLADALLYVKNERLEGFFLPSFGNGLIIADNDIAGIELSKYRLENNYYAILPFDNETTIKFLEESGLMQFRTSRRMFIGKKRGVMFKHIYHRISGQLG